MITPDRLAHLIGRRTPTEPKPDPAPAPAPAPPEPPPVIRIITTPADLDDDPTKPKPTHYEAAYDEIEQHREGIALDELADEAADTDPWTAAMKLFGGRQ